MGKNKTLKRLSGLIEDSSFKRLVAYENALWRAPGATENVFSVDQEMFGRTVTDQIRDAMITTITAKHPFIYISMFVQYTYLYPYTSFLLLLTSISISQAGKSLSYRLVGFSEISPPQSLFQLFTDFNLMSFIYL